MDDGRERREPKGSVTPKQGASHLTRQMLGLKGKLGKVRDRKEEIFSRSSLGLRRNNGRSKTVPVSVCTNQKCDRLPFNSMHSIVLLS